MINYFNLCSSIIPNFKFISVICKYFCKFLMFDSKCCRYRWSSSLFTIWASRWSSFNHFLLFIGARFVPCSPSVQALPYHQQWYRVVVSSFVTFHYLFIFINFLFHENRLSVLFCWSSADLPQSHQRELNNIFEISTMLIQML